MVGNVRYQRRITGSAVALSVVALVTACGSTPAAQGSSESSTPAPTTVTLLTHDSFVVSESLLADFTKETGLTLEIITAGDAGAMVAGAVLAAGSPTADVLFGVDNTLVSRALSAGVFEPYSPSDLGALEPALATDTADGLVTPVDYGDVCVNVDHTWFAAKGKPVPATLDDLTQPAYKDLFVTPGATTSSPGLAFLLATIGAKGDGWQAYWKALMANGTKITAGWTDAYSVDFSAGEGHGTRPIVLSYASSPPFTIPKAATEPTTKALLDTCFRQVEYAGVLAGARNPEGARALVSFLLSPAVQASIPGSMYMFPVDSTATLPTDWAKWAKVADKPFVVSPDQIAAQRDTWLRQWSEVTAK